MIEALEQRLKAADQKAETAETAKQASAASTTQRERSGIVALTSGPIPLPKRGTIRLSQATDGQTSSAH